MSDVLSQINAFVTIQRPTAAQDSTGQPTLALSTVYTNVPAAMQQGDTGQQVIYDADRNRYREVSFFRTDADIREKDWIVWGSRTFEVLGVNPVYDYAGFLDYYRVEMVETLGDP